MDEDLLEVVAIINLMVSSLPFTVIFHPINIPTSDPTFLIFHLPHQDPFVRFATNHEPPSSFSANFTSSSPLIDNSQFPDKGASYHITHDFSKLNLNSKPYSRHEQIQLGNGFGLPIHHTGSSFLSLQSYNCQLNNLLHASSIKKNLISMSKFCTDNGYFFEFHDTHFLVNDKWTNQLIISRSISNGIYKFSYLYRSLPPLLIWVNMSLSINGINNLIIWLLYLCPASCVSTLCRIVTTKIFLFVHNVPQPKLTNSLFRLPAPPKLLSHQIYSGSMFGANHNMCQELATSITFLLQITLVDLLGFSLLSKILMCYYIFSHLFHLPNDFLISK